MENTENIRARIRSDAIDKTVNAEKQNRHIRGSGEYLEGRSYLFEGVNAQELVDKYHGTGWLERLETGAWKSKETVTADMDVGVRVNPETGEKTTTDRFTIHYSNTGTHIVPVKRRFQP
ncbi:MAG: polymorphic toxin type 50 domain-containing protein [Defluviitaleaceae bacterium]|nr:polymorphic toxin type 50 domain-containing protein [Defluviitaleaceae bacterium]MCL2264259.1 polymorphic toxin type 50 domain-containing protein [Defluviitaleaceae bacterium]